MINYPERSQSLMTIERGLAINISGSVFDSNYIIDEFDPTKSQTDLQSQGIVIKDFVGTFTVGNQTIFKNYEGVRSSEVLKGNFIDEGYEDKYGTKIKFIAFERFKFRRFETAGLRFANNLIYKYKND